MNERITELAMKANSHTGNSFDLNHKELDVFLEKFAELIVQECIDAVEKTNDRHRRDYFADKIRQRFGVDV